MGYIASWRQDYFVLCYHQRASDGMDTGWERRSKFARRNGISSYVPGSWSFSVVSDILLRTHGVYCDQGYLSLETRKDIPSNRMEGLSLAMNINSV